jgi:uncharacterized metal-binding protein
MNETNAKFDLEVQGTNKKCPIGETVGKQNLSEGKIPVLSCEGACIRGEIARLAANYVAKNASFGRCCHGELNTVPDSAMAKWVNAAKKVVLIDGCFIRCQGRIIENMVGSDKLVQFDALSYHKQYCDKMDIDSVPERERKQVAQDVADWVLSYMEKNLGT